MQQLPSGIDYILTRSVLTNPSPNSLLGTIMKIWRSANNTVYLYVSLTLGQFILEARFLFCLLHLYTDIGSHT